MPTPLRQFMIALAALFLSAGHALCATLGAAHQGPLAAQTAAHAHHHAAPASHARHHAPDDPGNSSVPGQDCSHCAAFQAHAPQQPAAAAPSGKSFPAFLHPAAAAVAASQDHAGGLREMRLRWAAPPPRSQIALKVRLRN